MPTIWYLCMFAVTIRRTATRLGTPRNCSPSDWRVTLGSIRPSCGRSRSTFRSFLPTRTFARCYTKSSRISAASLFYSPSSINCFLIRKNKYVELITAQSVFEYIANGYDPEDTIMDNIRRVRIPFKSRSTTIGDAFYLMIEKALSAAGSHP